MIGSYEKADYETCIEESQQLGEILTTGSIQKDSVRFYEGLSYLQMGKRESASFAFETVSPMPNAISEKAGLYLGYRDLMFGDPIQNRIALQNRQQFGNPLQWEEWFVLEDAGNLLLSRQYSEFDSIMLQKENFSLKGREILQSFSAARGYYSKKKTRSPLLAAGLSLVIPGAGKMYSGRLGSGLMTLFITTTSGLQAFEGYRKNGFKSPQFWIFGALSAGWYLSGIYSSVIHTKGYNAKIETDFRNSIMVAFAIPFEQFLLR